MRVCVVGEGVVGCSSALALLQRFPQAQITVFHDRPFVDTCSFGPAGLFRISDEKNREFGRPTFEWFAKIHREYPGGETGVKLISGHIQSDSKETLEMQERAYADIVYNFRWLNDREIASLFPNPSKYCIHYTAFATEGGRYVPFLKNLLLEKGVVFKSRSVNTLDELGNEGFDVVVNCAGIDGGKLAADDDSIYSSRGVVLNVDAPWHKHFNYRDFSTFTIPKEDSIAIGTTRHLHNYDRTVTEDDVNVIMQRYCELHPAMKGAKIIRTWCGLRPERPTIRLEAIEKKNDHSKPYVIVHNYGHGGNGFTLGWGTALRAVELIQKLTPTAKL